MSGSHSIGPHRPIKIVESPMVWVGTNRLGRFGPIAEMRRPHTPLFGRARDSEVVREEATRSSRSARRMTVDLRMAGALCACGVLGETARKNAQRSRVTYVTDMGSETRPSRSVVVKVIVTLVRSPTASPV